METATLSRLCAYLQHGFWDVKKFVHDVTGYDEHV